MKRSGVADLPLHGGRVPQWLAERMTRLGTAITETIMLQEFWKEGQHDNTPDGKLGQGVSICFICEDALAIYREVTAKGIQASNPFVGNGMWVTSLNDPDGYKLEFESYTDVPEDTEYSDGFDYLRIST